MLQLKMNRNGKMIFLILALLGLSACSTLHDGKGFEHEPGETGIEHRH